MNTKETEIADKILGEIDAATGVTSRDPLIGQYDEFLRACERRHAMELPPVNHTSARVSARLTGEGATPQPTIGRTVIYTLSEDDAEAINRRRTTGPSIADRIKEGQWPLGAQAHIGNSVNVGEQYPAVIVRVWDDRYVNLRVILDGNDDYWATSRPLAEVKDQLSAWDWPTRG